MIESGMLSLKSGRWRWQVDENNRGEVMELVDPGEPLNKMIVPLPFSWRMLPEDQIKALARKPEVRLWVDSRGIFWRVAAVGPGTPYDYPLERRHLVFDSRQAWAGLVEFPDGTELGDLTSEDLQRIRDGMRDFGGRRRHFRHSAA